MACAAVTQILDYFVNPAAGGNNGKETQECELNASEPWTDLGIQGVKWLAASTAGGTLSLPGTSSTVSQVTGGLQFSTVFAGANQWEGCPTIPTTANLTPCPGLTPEQALYNVLAHYFDGTSVGTAYVKNRPLSGFDKVNDVGNFNYSKAPMNVLQMWDWDVLYTDGLSTCSMLQITGNPDASPAVLPNTTSCQATPSTVDNNGNTALQILSRANRQILRLAEEAPEPPAPPPPPPPPVKCPNPNGQPCQQ
jgi:hypothetical protein